MAGLNARNKPRLSGIIETNNMGNQRLSISWARGPNDLDDIETGISPGGADKELDKQIELDTKYCKEDNVSSSSAQPSPV